VLDGYKASLSYINSLTWSILSLSLVLLFLDPTAEKTSILGINFSHASVLYIGPLVLIILLLSRQIVIRNAADIVKSSRSKAELKALTKAYPLMEFIRWRASSKTETILLSVFQGFFIEYMPLYVTVVTASKINQTLWIKFVVGIIVGTIVGRIVQKNYSTLQKRVYEPLCGEIKTPD
jgi:uncharacterized membrane protein YecN with MAPEG domain